MAAALPLPLLLLHVATSLSLARAQGRGPAWPVHNYGILGNVQFDSRGEMLEAQDILYVGAITESSWHARSGTFGWLLLRGYRTYFSWREQWNLTVAGRTKDIRFSSVEVVQPLSTESTRLAVDSIVQKLQSKIILGPFDAEDLDMVSKRLLATGTPVLLLAPGNVLPSTLAANPFLFQVTTPPWPRHNLALGMVARRGEVGLSVAVLWEATPYHRYECSQLAEGGGAIAEHKLALVASIEVDPTRKRAFEEALSVIASRSVKVLVACFPPGLCTTLTRKLKASGLSFNALLLGDCLVEPLSARERRYHIAGVSSSPVLASKPEQRSAPSHKGWFQESSGQWLYADPHWDPYWIRFFSEQQYSGDPPHHMRLGMFTAYLLTKALVEAGTDDPQMVAQALRLMNTDKTPLGRVAFEQTGAQVGQVAITLQTALVGDRDIFRWIREPKDLFYPKPTESMLQCMERPQSITHVHGFGVDAAVTKCQPCGEKLQFWNESLQRTVCRYCNAGYKPFHLEGSEPKAFVCMPCSRGLFGLTGASCEVCPVGTFSSNLSSTGCQQCPPGKFGANAGASLCESCADFDSEKSNVEHYSAGYGNAACLKCPLGGTCPKNREGLRASMTNLKGYHVLRDAEGVDRVYPCLHKGTSEEGTACLADGKCFTDNEGRETMTGPFCGVCKTGWGRDASAGICRKCPGPLFSFLYMLVLYGALLTMCIGLTFLVLVTDFSKPKNQVAIILKICLSYVQLLTSVLPFVTFWQNSVFAPFFYVFTNSFASYNSFMSPWISVVGFSCLSQDLFPSYDAWKVRTFLGLLFIPSWMTQVALIFAAYWAFCRARGRELPTRTTFTSICIANLFVIHPRCNEILLEVFRCKVFDTSRMVQDPRVICNTADHRIWQIINGVGLLFYSLGIPLSILVMLVRVHSRGMLRDIKVIRSLGFMYAGFEPACYYFEPMLMIRRVLFPVVAARAISISSSTNVSVDTDHGTVLALLALNIFFLFIHAALQPFDNRSYFILDSLEDRSLWAILSLLLSQAFSTASNNNPAFNALTILWASLMNVRFFFLLAWGLGLRRFVEKVAEGRGVVYFSAPVVKVEEWGFSFVNVQGNDVAEKSLSNIFAELVHFHLLNHSSLTYRSFVTQLQRMSLVALQSKVTESSTKGPFDFMKKFIERSIDAGLMHKDISKHLTHAVERSEQAMATAIHYARKRFGSGGHEEVHSPVGHSPSGMLSPNGSEPASSRGRSRLAKTFGCSFTVEEMHRALLTSMRQMEAMEKSQAQHAENVEHDFGDDTLACAMGTPTHWDVAEARRQREENIDMESQRAMEPLAVKGTQSRSTRYLPPMQSVRGNEQELYAEKASIQERLDCLEEEKEDLVTKVRLLVEEQSRRFSSVEDDDYAERQQAASAAPSRASRASRAAEPGGGEEEEESDETPMSAREESTPEGGVLREQSSSSDSEVNESVAAFIALKDAALCHKYASEAESSASDLQLARIRAKRNSRRQRRHHTTITEGGQSASPTKSENSLKAGPRVSEVLGDLDTDLKGYRNAFQGALGSILPTLRRGPPPGPSSASSARGGQSSPSAAPSAAPSPTSPSNACASFTPTISLGAMSQMTPSEGKASTAPAED